MNVFNKAAAAMEMVKTSGFSATAERVRNFAYARRNERRRDKQFKRMKLEGPVVREILGAKMKLDSSAKGLDRDLLLDGIREPIATGHIMSLLGPDDVVLEVGANIGYYALIEARFCKRIYAVEPHPGNFERLKENIALNRFDNIEPFNLAFGSQSGEIPMQTSELANWHSCRNIDPAGKGVIQVPCLTVDEFVRDREKPTFMKMDVEGFEIEVLRGAKETLKTVGTVFLELHGDLLSVDEIKECIDLLREGGLKPSTITQYDRPGMALLHPLHQIDKIYQGDRGTFELFFSR